MSGDIGDSIAVVTPRKYAVPNRATITGAVSSAASAGDTSISVFSWSPSYILTYISHYPSMVLVDAVNLGLPGGPYRVVSITATTVVIDKQLEVDLPVGYSIGVGVPSSHNAYGPY
jgi:hypothetical protein